MHKRLISNIFFLLFSFSVFGQVDYTVTLSIENESVECLDNYDRVGSGGIFFNIPRVNIDLNGEVQGGTNTSVHCPGNMPDYTRSDSDILPFQYLNIAAIIEFDYSEATVNPDFRETIIMNDISGLTDVTECFNYKFDPYDFDVCVHHDIYEACTPYLAYIDTGANAIPFNADFSIYIGAQSITYREDREFTLLVEDASGLIIDEIDIDIDKPLIDETHTINLKKFDHYEEIIGQDVYFRFITKFLWRQLEFKGVNRSPTYKFYKTFDVISKVTAKRPSCGLDTFSIELTKPSYVQYVESESLEFQVLRKLNDGSFAPMDLVRVNTGHPMKFVLKSELQGNGKADFPFNRYKIRVQANDDDFMSWDTPSEYLIENVSPYFKIVNRRDSVYHDPVTNEDYNISKKSASDGVVEFYVEEVIGVEMGYTCIDGLEWEMDNSGEYVPIPEEDFEVIDYYQFMTSYYPIAYRLKNLSPLHTYNVVATSRAYGCPSKIPLTISNLKEPDLLRIEQVDISTVSCNTENTVVKDILYNDGEISLTWSGGIGPYTVEILSDSGIDSLSNISDNKCTIGNGDGYNLNVPLPVGDYSIRVYDRWGRDEIFYDTLVSIEANPEFTVEATTEEATCNDVENGIIHLSTMEDPGLFRFFSLRFGADIQETTYASTFTNKTAGDYFIDITNQNGCIESIQTQIYTLEGLLVESQTSDVLEFGDRTGIARLTIQGGIDPYKAMLEHMATGETFTIDETTGEAIFENLPAGAYHYTITDQNIHTSCQIFENDITILQPPHGALELSADITPITCFNGDDGVVELSASGGWESAYVFGMKSKDGSKDSLPGSNFSGLTYNGNPYIFYVRDARGIEDTLIVTIPQATKMEADSILVSPLQCYEDSSGAFSLFVSGGTPPYSYSLDGHITQSENEFKGLAAQTDMPVYVHDSQGCIQQISVTITQPDLLEIANRIKSPLQCYDDNSGSIELLVHGGTGSYRIIVGADTIAGTMLTNLPAIHDTLLTVIDENGCTVSVLDSLSQPQPLKSNVDVKHISCNGFSDGNIFMHMTGGTGSFHIAKDADSFIHGDSLKGLPAGIYTINIKDDNECNYSETVSLTEPLPLVFIQDSLHYNSCFGDSLGVLFFTMNGGISPYFIASDTTRWQENISVVSGLPQGETIIYYKDNNNCSGTITVTDTVQKKLQIAIDSVYALRCYNDASGAVRFSLQGGQTPYQVSDDLDNWKESDSLYGLSANNAYTLYVKDANECIADTTIAITQPDTAIYVIADIEPTYCSKADGQVSIDIYGGTTGNGYNVEWYSASQLIDTTTTLDSVFAGTYALRVFDENNCMYENLYPVNNVSAPEIDSISTDSAQCYGTNDGAIYIKQVSGGAGGYMYYINDSLVHNDSILNLHAGIYSVMVEDAKSCKATEIIEVFQPDSLAIQFHVKRPLCAGDSSGTLAATVQGGTPQYTFLWDNGITDTILYNIPSDIYSLTVSDVYGCKNSDSILLTNPRSLSANLYITQPSCSYSENGNAMLLPIGGTPAYTYEWSTGHTGSNAISKLSPGAYSVTIHDARACVFDTVFSIQSPTPIHISGSVIHPRCYDEASGAIEQAIDGGEEPYRCMWSIGRNEQNPDSLLAGEYKVRVFDAKGCVIDTTYLLQNPARIVVNYTETQPSCYGYSNGNIIAEAGGGTGELEYYWSTTDTTAILSNISSGMYTLSVSDENACEQVFNIELPEPTQLTFASAVKHVSCYGASDGVVVAFPSGGSGQYSMLWNTGDVENRVDTLRAGTYTVVVNDENGCELRDTFEVREPLQLTTDWLQHEATICAGNSYVLHAGEFDRYKWYLHGALQAKTEQIEMQTEGEWIFHGYNEYGCLAIDTFYLTVWDEPLEATMLLVDTVAVNEEVEALDVTWPVPDRIEWSYSEAVSEIDGNLWTSVFTYDTEGAVDVTLTAWLGSCFSSQTQTVYFSHGYTEKSGEVVYDSHILSYIVYPNPSNGNFTVAVELSEEMNSQLILYAADTYTRLEQRDYLQKEYSSSYNIQFKAGVYYLQLTAGKDVVTHKIVVW